MKENNMSDQNEQPQPDPVAGRGMQHSNQTPAEFIRSLGRLRSEQQWDVIREMLHPLVMRRNSAVQIAEIFDISVDTAYRWRKRYWADLRQEAISMQPRDFIMESVSSLRNVRAEAWGNYRNASSERDKRAYLQLVVQTEGQYIKLGTNIGLYGGRDDKPFSAGTYNEVGGSPHEQGAVLIHNLIAEMLSAPKTDPEETPILSDSVGEPEPYRDLLAELRTREEVQYADSPRNVKPTGPAQAISAVRQRRPQKPPQ